MGARGLPRIVALCAIVRWACIAAAPRAPEIRLPVRFSTTVEGHILESNYTVLLIEHYDYPGNRAHVTYQWGNMSWTSLSLGALDLRVTYGGHPQDPTFPHRCRGELLHSSVETMRGVDPSGHVVRTDEWFGLDDVRQDVYAGRGEARGVPTDVFTAPTVTYGGVSRSGEHAGVPYNVSYDLEIHYAAADWWLPGVVEEEYSHPLRIVMNGSIAYGDGTVKPILHYYEYSGFMNVGANSSEHSWADGAFALPAPSFCDRHSDGHPEALDPAVFDYARFCNMTDYCDAALGLLSGGESIPVDEETVMSVCNAPSLPYHGDLSHFLLPGKELPGASGAPNINIASEGRGGGQHSAGIAVAGVLCFFSGAALGAVGGVLAYRRAKERGFHHMPDNL